jgi:hypothetical protein
MAQTKKRRRRKHRGTQGGGLDSGRRRARPRSRAEARAQARADMSRRRKGGKATGPRALRQPTWSGAVNRALLGAGIFLLILLLLFKQPAGTSVALAVFMMVVYIPLGYSIDRFFYNRRITHMQRARQQNNGRP